MFYFQKISPMMLVLLFPFLAHAEAKVEHKKVEVKVDPQVDIKTEAKAEETTTGEVAEPEVIGRAKEDAEEETEKK